MTHLAVNHGVAADSENHALSALMLFYKEVLPTGEVRGRSGPKHERLVKLLSPP